MLNGIKKGLSNVVGITKKREDNHGFMKEKNWKNFVEKIRIVHVSQDGTVKDVANALRSDYGIKNEIINGFYLSKNSDPARYYHDYFGVPLKSTIGSLIGNGIINKQIEQNAKAKKKNVYNEIRNLDEHKRYAFMSVYQGNILRAYKQYLGQAVNSLDEETKKKLTKNRFMNRLKIKFGNKQLNEFTGVRSMQNKLKEEKQKRNGKNFNSMTESEIMNWIYREKGISDEEKAVRLNAYKYHKQLKREINENVMGGVL